MRSSTISTSKTNDSNYKLKQLILCPITNYNKYQIKNSNVRKSKNSQVDKLKLYVQPMQQLSTITLASFHSDQIIINSQALSFFSLQNSRQKVSFVGSYGQANHIGEFFKNAYQMVGVELPRNNAKAVNQLLLYSIPFKNMDHLTYFVHYSQDKSQSGKHQKILELISYLCSIIVLFVGYKQYKSNFLSQSYSSLERIKQQQANYFNFPSTCIIVHEKEIFLDESVQRLYENLFQQITVTKFQVTRETSISGSRFKDFESNKRVCLLFQSILKPQHIKNENLFVRPFLKQALLQVQRLVNRTRGTRGLQQQLSGQFNYKRLLAKLYQFKLAQSKLLLQQMLDCSMTSVSQPFQDLLSTIDRIEQKVYQCFDRQILDGHLHEIYRGQLEEYLQQIGKSIILNHQNIVEQRLRDVLSQQDDEEICDFNHLQSALRSLKSRYNEFSCDSNQKNFRVVSEKLSILARDGARLKVFGYDEKMRIGELRALIDDKWQQMSQVKLELQEYRNKPTENNLERVKFEMMEEQQRCVLNKIKMVKQQLRLQGDIWTLFQRQRDAKQNQCNQFLEQEQKNRMMIKFISNSKVENPIASSLEQRIRQLEQKCEQFSQGIHLFTQSLEPSIKT